MTKQWRTFAKSLVRRNKRENFRITIQPFLIKKRADVLLEVRYKTTISKFLIEKYFKKWEIKYDFLIIWLRFYYFVRAKGLKSKIVEEKIKLIWNDDEVEVVTGKDDMIPSIVEEIKKNIMLITPESLKSIDEFNPEMDQEEKNSIKSRIQKRAESGHICQNSITKAFQYQNLSKTEKQELLKIQLIPNPSIKQEVTIIPPVSLQEMRETRDLLAKTYFSFDEKNENAIYHVLNGIAQKNSLELVIRNQNLSPMTKDSSEKLIDFAMANEVITEDSIFLLGSDRPEHHIKCFSLKLNGPYQPLTYDSTFRKGFVQKVKEKLADAFQVHPNKIVIVSLNEGSVKINFTVKDLNENDLATLDDKIKTLFPEYLKLDFHPSFYLIAVNSSSFSAKWNRNFSIESNYSSNGKKRGGYDYHPPKGYMRYALNVSGKFDNGNDNWLGMNNTPGEWAVAYHGTAATNVPLILNTSLRSGGRNQYGKGIYCSPLVASAGVYTGSAFPVKTKDGQLNFKYIFMCRVNVNKPHRCTKSPCPEAENSDYTIHFTTRQNYWFVNLKNDNYEHIRCYGILVKQV